MEGLDLVSDQTIKIASLAGSKRHLVKTNRSNYFLDLLL
jgi:hypothetical protein